MAAAAIIFFAFYGFDAIATAAEETKNPGRDLKIGIVGSMVACVIIYMAVAGAAIGALAYTRFANSPEPLALILREIGQPLAAQYLGVSAVVALPTVILAFFYGQSRIFFVMARDGLLPQGLARVVGPRLAGPDHDLHRDRRRGARRPDPARRARRARQCRHADRLHRGRGLHAGDAPARARRGAPVPHALGLAGRDLRRSSAASICSTACRSGPRSGSLCAQVVGLVLYLRSMARGGASPGARRPEPCSSDLPLRRSCSALAGPALRRSRPRNSPRAAPHRAPATSSSSSKWRGRRSPPAISSIMSTRAGSTARNSTAPCTPRPTPG